MKSIIKIIIFIAFIYIIGSINDIFSNKYYKRGSIPNNVMKYFKGDYFLNKIQNLPVIYLEYKDDDLNPKRYVNSTVKEFIKLNNTREKRQQVKQSFNEDRLSKYFLEYGYYPIVKHFNIKNSRPFIIRISNSKWTFDYHYDCMDLLLVQLSGTRVVYLKEKKNSKEKRYTLNAGDTLYIPIGVYHRVETHSGLNINFNIILETDIDKMDKCNKQFSKDYKVQYKKCENNNCV